MKAEILFTEAQLLAVVRREVRIPGTVSRIEQRSGLLINDEETAMALTNEYLIAIDFDPIICETTCFSFLSWARAMYGSELDISGVKDEDAYAVLENLIATSSTFGLFSFSWVGG